MIDWAHFTPLASFAGGILIGLATALFLLVNGRIAGISGILGGLLRPVRQDVLWRVLFILGLAGSPFIYSLLAEPAQPVIEAGTGTLVLAGLLVGIGTRYGSGCTSGHGICGISRLSPRSFVATVSFIAAGMVTVYLVKHITG
ncbi:MAG TPA: YeeE/YedE family protein [Methylophilaceae bacterium]|nr:YeeE/YedE family protein [Methylophilaceae bacterium]